MDAVNVANAVVAANVGPLQTKQRQQTAQPVP